MQVGYDFKIKKSNPRLLLHSVKDAFLAWIGVKGTQLTLNLIAFSNVKTLKYSIGAYGVAGCDANFAADNGVTEQPFDLGAVIPAFARVLDVKTVTSAAFAAVSHSASYSVTSNVLTMTTAVAHGLVSGTTVVIAGMTVTAHNGTFVVTVTGATTFTYACTTPDAESTADTGGVITATTSFTLVAETGNATSGNQFIASATILALNAITAAAAGGPLAIAPNAAATHVWCSITPAGVKWLGITAGKVDIHVTYIEAV
jgi:hypothetical protein